MVLPRLGTFVGMNVCATELTQWYLPGCLASLLQVPFAWLLPQAGLVIHHGGSGSVSECMHAGVPQVRTGAPTQPQPRQDSHSSQIRGHRLPFRLSTINRSGLTRCPGWALAQTPSRGRR